MVDGATHSLFFFYSRKKLGIKTIFANFYNEDKSQAKCYADEAVKINFSDLSVMKELMMSMIQIFCILATFSRAAFFSVFIIICMLFFQMRNYKKIIVAIMLVIVVLGALLTTGVFDYISDNYVRLEASGDSGRFKLWEYAWG